MYEALVLLSEVVLSAYPMLIKLVDASVVAQTGLRMTVFAALGAIVAKLTGAPLPSLHPSTESVWTGALNLCHVLASYFAFSTLPAGNAMALFYTYPLWNLVGASATLGEAFPWRALPWMAVALVGAVLLARPTSANWPLLGIVAALVAAITETGIYLWFRQRDSAPEKGDSGAETDQPWTKMTQMYGSSAVLWAIGALIAAAAGMLAAGTLRMALPSLATILGFNAAIGFVGYALRFYLIPKVSTVAFSVMSFFGVLSAYGLDWLFTGTLPTATQALGAAAIVLANTVLLRKETV